VITTRCRRLSSPRRAGEVLALLASCLFVGARRDVLIANDFEESYDVVVDRTVYALTSAREVEGAPAFVN
jgi:hypothetical protein